MHIILECHRCLCLGILSLCLRDIAGFSAANCSLSSPWLCLSWPVGFQMFIVNVYNPPWHWHTLMTLVSYQDAVCCRATKTTQEQPSLRPLSGLKMPQIHIWLSHDWELLIRGRHWGMLSLVCLKQCLRGFNESKNIHVNASNPGFTL